MSFESQVVTSTQYFYSLLVGIISIRMTRYIGIKPLKNINCLLQSARFCLIHKDEPVVEDASIQFLSCNFQSQV